MSLTDSNLEEKKRKNQEQRREFVIYWARFVRENPDEEWSRQQNKIINSQIETARQTQK